jgi:predicted RNase H-like nuclease (RuvC/YqgF family)
MFTCKVGNDFKINYFKRNLNFCYDQKNGIIYSDEVDTFIKLGIDRRTTLIEDLNEIKLEHFLTKQEVEIICQKNIEEIIKKSNKQLEKQQKDVENLKKEKEQLKQSVSEIVEVMQEVSSLIEEKQYSEIESKTTTDLETLKIKTGTDLETLKNSVGLLNKKSKESKEEIKNLQNRFDAVLELISENVAKTGKMPNPMEDNNLTLRKIWNTVEDKNSASILSVMIMMKKALEDKGMKF